MRKISILFFIGLLVFSVTKAQRVGFHINKTVTLSVDVDGTIYYSNPSQNPKIKTDKKIADSLIKLLFEAHFLDSIKVFREESKRFPKDTSEHDTKEYSILFRYPSNNKTAVLFSFHKSKYHRPFVKKALRICEDIINSGGWKDFATRID